MKYAIALTAVLSFAVGAAVMDDWRNYQQSKVIEQGASEQRLVCWHREIRGLGTQACS